jgi:hypothetical protein
MNGEIIGKKKVFVKFFLGDHSTESLKSPKWLKLNKIAIFYVHYYV